MFLKHGIDINMVVKNKSKGQVGTALTYAVMSGTLEVVKFLSTRDGIDFGVESKGCNLLPLAAERLSDEPI